jgi:N-acetylmuramic acid 6-phosphate etherase
MDAQVLAQKYAKRDEEAREFLKISEQFRLGNLPTETPHPKTTTLSQDSKSDLAKAISTIKNIDIEVFQKVKTTLPQLKVLQEKILETITGGNNIYLCGCGATGRLSLALETIWRHQNLERFDLRDRIISFMAGGDVALIHSVEKFEDFPDFGERQLLELGFKDGDLLISCTEGGETPFVIGATEAAARISHRKPFFLYCNPDEILITTAERSKAVILDPKIEKINLSVGPMALTGSTRMQATTILMYAVGLCLWYYDRDYSQISSEANKIIDFVNSCDFNFLTKFIERESEIYSKGEYIFYETDAYLGISILTDTTERSPTFSLYPFENQQDQQKSPSLSYLYFRQSDDSSKAWFDLLKRKPRCFHWKEITDQTTLDRLMGFDFSAKLIDHRAKYLQKNHHHFVITFDERNNALNFQLNELTHTMNLGELNFLSAHLVLKVLMNNLSTLIMGRMDRYESNLMTWVRASNNKLVDRAVRYASILLRQKGIDATYSDLVHACFRLKDDVPRDQALVLKMVEEIAKR